MKNKVRNNYIKESLLEYSNLADTLKENTQATLKDILKEAVLEQYAKVLTEDEDKDEDKDYDVEEVEDTDFETQSDDDVADDATDGMDSEDTEDEVGDETDDEVAPDEEDLDDVDTADDVVDDSTDDVEDGWSDFDEKYKVSDSQYDFSEANDDDIVKVYKLLKDDDQIVVTKDNDKVEIKDNETGAEYLIQLGSDNDFEDDVDDAEFEIESDDDFGDDTNELENDIDDMNESRIFELALNEYNSNVGYTDNYQNKDVMTSDGVAEPGKNVNDWDKGVPHDTKKPWSGKKGGKKENQPFHAEKGKQVEEAFELELETPINELKTRQEHTANVGSTSRTDGDNGNRRRKGRSYHTAEKGQVTGTGDNAYSPSVDIDVNIKNESVMIKADKIFKENKQLKSALTEFRKTLQEAAVTNVSLGHIVRLVMENSTSNDEKKEIVERFSNEVKSIEDSKALYEAISRDLKKKTKMDINEATEFGATKQINETQIYRSEDLLGSLDLMHRICK
jgi:hypothetical protein